MAFSERHEKAKTYLQAKASLGHLHKSRRYVSIKESAEAEAAVFPATTEDSQSGHKWLWASGISAFALKVV